VAAVVCAGGEEDTETALLWVPVDTDDVADGTETCVDISTVERTTVGSDVVGTCEEELIAELGDGGTTTTKVLVVPVGTGTTGTVVFEEQLVETAG